MLLDFHAVLDAMADACIVSDASGRVAYANPAALRLLGYDRGELEGSPLMTLMPERMRAAHEHGFRRYVETGASRIMGRPVRVPAMRKDGVEVDVELTLSRLALADREIILACLRDLRDRVELERQIEAQRRLRAQYSAMEALASMRELDAERVLAAIARSLDWPVGVLWLAAGEELRCAGTFAASEAFVPFAAASRPFTFRKGVGIPGEVWSDGRPRTAADVHGLRNFPRHEHADVVGIRGAVAFPIVSASGVCGVAELYSSRGEQADAELLETVATIGWQIGQFLDRAAAEAALAEAVRAREDFIAVASHELRTPLASIRLNIDRLVRGAPAWPTEQILEAVRSADRQVTRLTLLVGALLDVTRIWAGRLRLELAEVDLVAIVGEVAGRSQQELASAGCALTLALPPSLIGRWDGERLDQIVSNLLTNALKYGPGKPIEIAATQAGNVAVLTVSDHGIGVAPVDHARIFERFGRAVSTTNYGGFGLGLWIVKIWAEALGGQVEVESDVGRGARFRVMLPLAGPG